MVQMYDQFIIYDEVLWIKLLHQSKISQLQHSNASNNTIHHSAFRSGALLHTLVHTFSEILYKLSFIVRSCKRVF